MKKLTRLLAMVLALLVCALPVLAETTPDDVMATVNGAVVTRAEYEAQLAELENTYSAYGYDVKEATIAAVLQQMAMLTCVEYELLDAKITAENLQMTDEEKADAAQEARESWQEAIELSMQDYGVTDATPEEQRAAVMLQVLAMYESAGYTEEKYIGQMLTYAGYDKLYDWIVRDVTVTEEEIRARYDSLVEADKVAYEHDVSGYETMLDNNQMYLMWGMTDYYVDLYYSPVGYRRVTHILLMADEEIQNAYAALAADPTADPAALELARQAVLADVQPSLDEINMQLKEGVPFAELIPMYTQDPGMSDAAAVAEGYLVHPESTKWVTEFRDAAFTVDQPGDVTEPVLTSYGVHLLQYVEDVPGGPVEYTDDIRALLREELLSGRQANAYSSTVQEWMDEAEIVYAEEMAELMSGL